MRNAEKLRTRALELSWLTLLTALWTVAAVRLNHPSITAAAHPVHSPVTMHAAVPVRPAPICKTGLDEELAWCEFEQLTNAKKAWPTLPLPAGGIPEDTRPLWTEWADKCELLLGPCVQERQSTPLANQLPQELLALTNAVQLDLPIAPGPRISHALVARAPRNNLASVLFSPAMAAEAKRLSNLTALNAEVQAANTQGESGAYREISDKSLDATLHPTVVKLIWEVVRNKDPNFTAQIYQDDGSNFSSAKNYQIDTSEAKPCADADTLPAPSISRPLPIVNVNCFYHYAIDTHDPRTQQLTNTANNVLTANNTNVGWAMLILVGAHVMVFDETHHLWQWMTFYWTPTDNGNHRGWANPWLHYQMMTASTANLLEPLKIAGDSNHKPGVIANPYLEGHVGEMQSNCVSCHSLAAYSSRGLKKPQAIALDNVTPDYPDTLNAANHICYFDDSIRTHFIWSIANNPLLNQNTAPDAACSTGTKNFEPNSSRKNSEALIASKSTPDETQKKQMR